MIKNYDESVEINHNPNWSYIPDHLYRILIIDRSGSGKTNVLLNLIKHQRPDIDKIYLHVKFPLESKYQLLINGREKVGIENLKNPKAFIDYLQTTDHVYENLEDYNPKRKRRVLIVFWWYDSRYGIVTELFWRGRKLNMSLVFLSQSYFKMPKTIRLNATHYFIMKIPNKRELQQIASKHSPDIIHMTLSSNNPLWFRKNLL